MSAQTLVREFREETGAEITVGGLKWVEEVFFTWDGKANQQICLYYEVALKNDSEITFESFTGCEYVTGSSSEITFHWIALDGLNKINVYPENIAELLDCWNRGVQHFVSLDN